MRRLLAVAGLVTLAAGSLAVMAVSPAGAANAKGCSGSGVSLDSDGKTQIDTASAPGKGGTASNPFDVTTDGKVKYDYTIKGGSLAGGTWKVKIDTGLFPISFSGKISKSSSQTGHGVEPLKKHLQIGGLAALVGLLKVEIVASNGRVTCTVSGYIKIHDSIFTTPAFYLALIFLMIALLLFFLGMGKPV